MTCQFACFENKKYIYITLTVADKHEKLQEYLAFYYFPAAVTKAWSHFFITNILLERGRGDDVFFW